MIDVPVVAAQFPQLHGLNFVGRGGQKLVYSADFDGHRVALKLVESRAVDERFLREVEALQILKCPGIPKQIDSGTVTLNGQDFRWLTEEWVPGESLALTLAKRRLSNVEILAVAKDVLDVLCLAEEKSIVHRDIKPANILLRNDPFRAMVTDFGIARLLSKTSQTFGPIGPHTVGYAPPEQFRNAKRDIDARADLYALGVTLYECVEGVNVFLSGKTDAGQVLADMEGRDLPRLSRHIDSKREFADLVEAMSKCKAAHRLRTARDAREWIEEILKHGPA